MIIYYSAYHIDDKGGYLESDELDKRFGTNCMLTYFDMQKTNKPDETLRCFIKGRKRNGKGKKSRARGGA